MGEMNLAEATPFDIDALAAGPELDRLIAERVMGCKVAENFQGNPICGCNEHRPHNRWWNEAAGDLLTDYSADIFAAWAVVEKVINADHDGADYWFDLQIIWRAFDENPVDYRPCIRVTFNKAGERGFSYGYFSYHGEADTVPLAICRAALKAVEGK